MSERQKVDNIDKLLDGDMFSLFFKKSNKFNFKYKVYALHEFFNIVKKSKIKATLRNVDNTKIKYILRTYRNKILAKCLITFYRFFNSGYMVKDEIRNFKNEEKTISLYEG